MAIAKEDLSLKNRIMEQMEKAELNHLENMTAFAQGISSLNATLSHGLALLAAFPQQPTQFNYSNYQQPWGFQTAMPTNNNTCDESSDHWNANSHFTALLKL